MSGHPPVFHAVCERIGPREVLREGMLAFQPRKTEPLAGADGFQDQMIAWNVLIEPAETVRVIESMNAADTRVRLSELLSNVWTDRWRKAKAQKRTPPKHTGKRCHASAFRMIEEARLAKSKTATGPAAK